MPTAQLTPQYAVAFNRTITDTRSVPLSILAGKSVPFTCQEPSTGDLVVSLRSALWTIADREVRDILHTDMNTSPGLFADFVRPRLALDASSAPRAAAAGAASRGRTVAGRVSARARAAAASPPRPSG